MSDFDVKEKRFEEDIEDYLTHHGGCNRRTPPDGFAEQNGRDAERAD